MFRHQGNQWKTYYCLKMATLYHKKPIINYLNKIVYILLNLYKRYFCYDMFNVFKYFNIP